MAEYVLDASALLALLNEEPGAEKVRPLLPRSIIGAVNFCETLQRLRRSGMSLEEAKTVLTPLVFSPIPFDEHLSYVSASIHSQTREYGLSFGDCACLAVALSRHLPAVTAERDWDKFDIGVSIIKIR